MHPGSNPFELSDSLINKRHSLTTRCCSRTPGESCGKVTGEITPEPHSKTERHSEAEHGYNVTGSMNGAARSEDQITYATAQGA